MGIIADHKTLAQELTHYSRLCYDRRLVGAAGGNLSVRVPDSRSFLVTASGVALRDVEPENLVVVDEAGKVLEGPSGLKASKEIGFHLGIYAARSDIQAVIHVHPTFVTVFSSMGRTIPLITICSRLKTKQGRLIEEADPGSQTLCNYIKQEVQQSSSDIDVLVMKNHGLVAYGNSLTTAFDSAELVENTAEIAYRREMFQTPVDPGCHIIDLSAPLGPKTQSYPTDPQFDKNWHTHMETDGSYVSRLQMGAHFGTHVDAPMHFLEGGGGVNDMELSRFAGRAVAFDVPKEAGQNIDVADIVDEEIRPGEIVLFHTGWQRYSCTDSFFDGDWPAFTPELVQYLLQNNVKAVGGDIASADNPSGIAKGATAHKLAAQAGMPIFEALVNMDKIVGRRFFFAALPLKLENCEASPVRAVAFV